MESFTCIIETPKGCGAKYDFNTTLGCYELKKVLPAGLVFPFDFGYVPGTVGEDGDPLDVIVISELPTFAGCAMKCFVIGSIKAMQRERDGDRMRNDRYIAIPEASVMYKDIRKMSQLPRQIMEEIETFFINYNQQAGKQFKPLEWMSAHKAVKVLETALGNAVPYMLIQLLLPLCDEAGQAFPEKYYTAIKKKLTEKFRGVTAYIQSPATGLWRESAQKTTSDKLIIYEVMVSEIDTSFWKSYKAQLEKQFRQKELIIRRSKIGLL